MNENNKLIILGCAVFAAIVVSFFTTQVQSVEQEAPVIPKVERKVVQEQAPAVSRPEAFVPFSADGRAGDGGRMSNIQPDWIARNRAEADARLDRLNGRS